MKDQKKKPDKHIFSFSIRVNFFFFFLFVTCVFCAFLNEHDNEKAELVLMGNYRLSQVTFLVR